MEDKPLAESIVYICEYFFITKEQLENRKTPIYYVFNTNAICIATIKWYSAWRRFCLFPEGVGTIWDSVCLANIESFLNIINNKYKYNWKEQI